MPYSRQRARIAPNGRVSIRLTAEQRDLFLRAPGLPKNLFHLLRHAVVKGGKLSASLGRDAVDTLIAIAAEVRLPDRGADRELTALLRYLESRADRFEEPAEHAEVSEPPVEGPG